MGEKQVKKMEGRKRLSRLVFSFCCTIFYLGKV
jgi:hypothetical protein